MSSAEPIPADFLALLRCPHSGQTLTLATPAQVAQAHARQAVQHLPNEGLPNSAAPIMSGDFAAALVRADGKALYPIRDGIPVLLPDEAIYL